MTSCARGWRNGTSAAAGAEYEARTRVAAAHEPCPQPELRGPTTRSPAPAHRRASKPRRIPGRAPTGGRGSPLREDLWPPAPTNQQRTLTGPRTARARGLDSARRSPQTRGGACTGIPATWEFRYTSACGEQSRREGSQATAAGPSPRSRGAERGDLPAVGAGRAIPAIAGSSRHRRCRSGWASGHPRNRGEQTSRPAALPAPLAVFITSTNSDIPPTTTQVTPPLRTHAARPGPAPPSTSGCHGTAPRPAFGPP